MRAWGGESLFVSRYWLFVIRYRLPIIQHPVSSVQHPVSSIQPRLLATVCGLLFATYCYGQTPKLSPNSSISLITVSPGEELYSGFGHSALWVADPQSGIDRVYNYGTFDFRTDGFYIKFLRGILPYQLSVGELQRTLYGAQVEERIAKEQVLNLSPEQKQRVFEFLETNYLPQNREYQYKFFYDNCSSRLRDVLEKTLGDSLVFKNYLTNEKAKFSYRNWIDFYTSETKPWSDFGMNLAIGQPSDELVSYYRAMFLPDNLSDGFGNAVVKSGGSWHPLVEQSRTLYTPSPPLVPTTPFFTPNLVMWGLLLLVLILTVLQIRSNNKNLIVDKILFAIVGLAGWLLTFLWVGTNHGVTTYNWNLLWTIPLHVPFVFFLSSSTKKPWLSRFYLICGLLCLFTLLGWAFFPQQLHPAAFPLIILLAIRTFRISFL